jgi:hypothetical protein
MSSKDLHFYISEAASGGSFSPVNKVDHPTTIIGEIVGSDMIAVSWETLPGNLPATNGNLLALWQNQGIPYGQAPIQKKSIVNDTPTGDQLFRQALQRKPYIAAYGTTDTNKAWAATVQFLPGSTKGIPFVTSIDCVAVGNNFLVAAFKTPTGNVPSANGNWVGLWEGPVVTFDGTNRIKKVDVTGSTSDGSQEMNGLELKINTTYSIGYAVGPKDTDLAAWQTFTTAPF